MSHLHVQRLSSVRQEYKSALASLAHSERIWPDFALSNEAQGLRRADIQQTSAHLEATYLIRLFTQFEAILRDDFTQRKLSVPYKTETLINKAASQARIDSSIVTGAHSVRVCRNGIVHGGKMNAPTIPFNDALALLNYCLSRIR